MKTNFKPIIIVAVIALAIALFTLPQMNVAALSESAINANVESVDSTDATVETIPATEETEIVETESTEPSTEAPETTPATQPEETEPEATEPKATEPVETEPEVTEPVHTHNYNSKVTAPTCTEGGYTTHTCGCGKSYTDSKTNATGHNYESVVTAPAIGAVGYTTHTCKNCGDVYVDSYVDALIPEPTEPETEPTEPETEPTEPEAPVHVHNYVANQIFAPTCTAEGCTVYVCECGDSYEGDFVEATQHQYTTYVVDPTYEEEGYDLHVCDACGYMYKDNYVPVKERPVEEEEEEEVEVEEDGFIHKEFHCDCNDGHLHDVVKQGAYTYNYCEHVSIPHKSPDGFTVWYPYDWYF